MVDRFGVQRVTISGLAGITVGCLALAVAPAATGIAGYLIPIVSSPPTTRFSRRRTTPA
jgi:hypothetical protein